MRGHLLALVTIMAFSVETLSLGKPHEFQVRTSYASANTFNKLHGV